MAKQVKADKSKTKKATEPIEVAETQGRLVARSPLTNLFFAAILGILYLAVFDRTPGQSLIYAGIAFLFFNTVDYCILYYRMNKRSK